jgi:hypothetical protein
MQTIDSITWHQSCKLLKLFLCGSKCPIIGYNKLMDNMIQQHQLNYSIVTEQSTLTCSWVIGATSFYILIGGSTITILASALE